MIDEPNNNEGQSFNSDSEPQQMPLGVGDDLGSDNGLDPLAGAETKSTINTGAVLIALVIAIASGGLFVMRTLAKMTNVASADTTTEEKINAFLDVITGNAPGEQGSSTSSAGDESALHVLRETYTDRQVPLDNVQRNPFVLDGSRSLAATPDNPRPTGRTPEQITQAMRKRFEQAGARLSVDSTLLGSTPLANINGDIYRVGDVLYDEKEDVSLKIVKIESKVVHLLGVDNTLGLEVPVVLNIDF